MGGKNIQPAKVWAVANQQHGVITRRQLLDFGYTTKAIEHRIKAGRLHRVWSGVYAVGRPVLTRDGRLMAAVLSCGSKAVLSHLSSAELWMLRPPRSDLIHVSVPVALARHRRSITVHRRAALDEMAITRHRLIPVTTPIRTLADIAPVLSPAQLEAAVNEADKRDLVDPEQLRSAVAELQPTPGTRALRVILDRPTFTLTDSALERCFLPITRKAGLSAPLSGQMVNGFKVDFFWPDLGLVVETDGLRYHRTPAQQARDRLRDQAHTAAGLTPLRFTRAQVRFEPDQVEATLAAVAERLRSGT